MLHPGHRTRTYVESHKEVAQAIILLKTAPEEKTEGWNTNAIRFEHGFYVRERHV